MPPSSQMEEGTLVIYYSDVFPNFVKHRSGFEQKSIQTGASFVERYKSGWPFTRCSHFRTHRRTKNPKTVWRSIPRSKNGSKDNSAAASPRCRR